jgi:AraC-like DNA-binding protein
MTKSLLSKLDRVSEHLSRLPTTDAGFAQLGGGPLDLLSLKILGKDILLVRMEVRPLLAGYVGIDPGWCVFYYPLSWSGDYRFNVMLADPDDIFLVASPEGYASLAKKRSSLVIAIRKERLCTLISARTGVPREKVHLSDRRLAGVAGKLAFCERFVASGFTLSDEIEGLEYTHVLGAAGEAVLLEQFLDFHESLLLQDDTIAAWQASLRTIVRQVEEALERLPEQQLTLSQLCELTGTGKTRLSEAFEEVHGESPIRFLRMRALSAVREQLLDRENPPSSVKSVALAHGFLHKSRFAAAYRELYGELPHETLKRTWSNASHARV